MPDLTSRISLDLDTPEAETVLATAARLIMNERNVSKVAVWRSASGIGHHIIGVLVEPIPCWHQFALRRKYGDDEKRIAHSVKNVQNGLKLYDVLFTTKFWADGSSSDAKPLYEIRKTEKGFELRGLNE